MSKGGRTPGKAITITDIDGRWPEENALAPTFSSGRVFRSPAPPARGGRVREPSAHRVHVRCERTSATGFLGAFGSRAR